MPAADTARLIASLELKDKFSATANKAIGKVGALESKFSGLGHAASKGVKAAAIGIAGIGTVAAVGIGRAIQTGLEDLAALEDATTSVDGAIKQLGLTGQVSASQVADWANEIESAVGAAFDDKAITAATTTLLRFGKVTPQNLRPAMVVMTDLATKTGDVDSAATLLAKALADPAKAAGKLSRAGVILTKTQQDQIKAFVKAGKVGEAQALILDEISKSTAGAADASQGKYRRALSLLADAGEDARKALAEGFLPVIERVSTKLSAILADPKAVQSIRDFGSSLAGAFDKAVDFAESVDWKSVGDGLKTAASWAKTLFDAFMSMPTEAKAAIFALAGLNKLSGGAVSSIIGELGKGLIKGVLGINAGVVNVTGGVVNGPGGVVPGGVKVPPVTPGIVKPTIGAGVALELGPALDRGTAALGKLGVKIDNQTGKLGGKVDAIGGPIVDKVQALKADTIAEQIATRNATTTAVDAAKVATVVQGGIMAAVIGAGTAQTLGAVSRTTAAAQTAGYQTANAMAAAAARIVGAVNALDLSVNVTTINRTSTVNNRYGPSGGSANTDRIGGK